ncbi:MAG: VanZ family protein [Eubacteriales bacterium]|nr:VanZ family protein [Eubacteriales bacterium]
MKDIAVIAYGFLCVMLPALGLYRVLHTVDQTKGIAEPRYRLVMILALSAYVAGVFYFTGAGTVYDIRQYGLGAMALRVNLIPFSAGPIDTTGYLLNVVLFLPLGFLLPLIWPEKDHIWDAFFAGLAFSLLIELSQLLNLRATDIDDLLLNTVGAEFGYALYRVYAAITQRKKRAKTGLRAEALLYFAVMFLGRFLLFNEFGFAKILYGF